MAKAEKKRQPKIKARASANRSARRKPLTKKEARLAAKKEAATQHGKMPGSFRLTARTFGILRRHWRALGSIVLVYTLINLIFASGLSSFNSTITSVEDVVGQSPGAFSGGLDGFVSLLGSGSGSALQSVLVIIESLVIIWALRHLLAGKKIGVKEAYYHATGPLIPFVLVILVIIIQLLPLTLGTAALGVVLTSVFTSDAAVTIIFSILFALLAAWSLYMLCSSIMAMYIVTLPNMPPRHALRAAKNLVSFRRWQLMRRLVFLPIFLLLVMAVIILPLVLLLPSLAVIVFYLLGMVALLFGHAYLYSLYRSLL